MWLMCDCSNAKPNHELRRTNLNANRNNEVRLSGAVDQEAFEKVIRDNLSPEGVTALVMALQPAGSIPATTPEGEQALQQVIWFRNTLLDLIGVETFNETIDELGF